MRGSPQCGMGSKKGPPLPQGLQHATLPPNQPNGGLNFGAVVSLRRLHWRRPPTKVRKGARNGTPALPPSHPRVCSPLATLNGCRAPPLPHPVRGRDSRFRYLGRCADCIFTQLRTDVQPAAD